MHNVYEYTKTLFSVKHEYSEHAKSMVVTRSKHTLTQTHKNIKKKRMVKNYKSFGTEPFPHTSSKKQKEGKTNAILASKILYHIIPCRSLTTYTYTHTGHHTFAHTQFI